MVICFHVLLGGAAKKTLGRRQEPVFIFLSQERSTRQQVIWEWPRGPGTGELLVHFTSLLSHHSCSSRNYKSLVQLLFYFVRSVQTAHSGHFTIPAEARFRPTTLNKHSQWGVQGEIHDNLRLVIQSSEKTSGAVQMSTFNVWAYT